MFGNQVIVLVDACPLTRSGQKDKGVRKNLLSARQLAPDRAPPQDLENRWTLDDVWDSIKEDSQSARFSASGFSPHMIVSSIFKIFQCDLVALASRSQDLIEEISEGIRDPARVDENTRTSTWENVLANLAGLDPIARHTIGVFSMVFSVVDSPHPGPLMFSKGPSVTLANRSGQTGEWIKVTSQLLEILNQVSAAIDKTQSAFEARIALAERQHQLHEANTVKRLTELAFLFVPLSFSTSIFGMEMKVRGRLYISK